MRTINDIFGPAGPLSEAIDGFAPRLQQLEMAQVIADALEQGGQLIAEAGTGTGKTFAYLVPALLSDKKVIVSMGTKNLQDQLYYRDLPMVKSALGVSASIALLKGRANYLCHYRLEKKQRDGRLPPAQMDQLSKISYWLEATQSGDVSELDAIEEDAPIWPQVTSTADNCLGMECPNVNDCFVLKARKAAQKADVLVINHHLFFADLALRDEGFGEILPGADAFIFDEAHQLSDVAPQFFGIHISSRQLFDIARDALAEIMQNAGDEGQVQSLIDPLEKAIKDFRLLFQESERRGSWDALYKRKNVIASLLTINEHLEQLEKLLNKHAERSAGIEKCWQRVQDILNRLSSFLPEPDETVYEPDPEQQDSAHDVTHIRWYEISKRGFVLHLTPTSIAGTFHNYMNSRESTWIFTSATLAVGERFDYFASNLGVEDAQTRLWDSPFDYRTQGLIYLPPDLPEPNTAQYTQAVVDAAIPVINACGGRTFLLVTSYRALNEAAQQLAAAIEFPLLIQGQKPRTELLNQFRALGNAVLIGTSSFWEGVDVKGDALSCVIIDKLPFAAPDEPILQARLKAIRDRGENPFFSYQIPEAVISLKQGVGRLIRDGNDRGILMLCDPRLSTKPYGKIFMKNLPDMDVTTKFADVESFMFETID